jgi:AraC-like DNA-binding protein
VAPARWTGRLEVGRGWARWSGAVGDAGTHRHFAAQAVVAPAPVGVVTPGGRLEGRVLFLEPLVPHRLEPAAEAELYFLDPSLGCVADAALAPLRRADGAVVGGERGFWRGWREGGGAAPRAVDARIERALGVIDRGLAGGSLPLGTAARAAGLSPERFRHLFADVIGLPYRRYLLWRRVGCAVAEIARGASATSAAHGAGFADAAHFARTMRATFGVTASDTLLSA